MSQINFNEKAVRVHGLNCHNEVVGIQDETGKTKIHCPKCGAITISKVMGRRHIRVDIFAPQGQEIIV